MGKESLKSRPVGLGLGAVGGNTTIIITEAPVGNNLINIELFGVTKSITLGAGTNGRVEGEESWLYFRNSDTTVRAGVLLVIELSCPLVHVVYFNQTSTHIAGLLHGFTYTSPCFYVVLDSIHNNGNIVFKLLFNLWDTLVKVIYLSVDLRLQVSDFQGIFQDLSVFALLSSCQGRENDKFAVFRMGEDEIHDLVYRYFSYFPATLGTIQMTDSCP